MTDEQPELRHVTESEQEQPYRFSTIADGFRQNIHGLRVFAERIGEAAATHDRSAMETFAKVIDQLLPDELLLKRDEEGAPIEGEFDDARFDALVEDPDTMRQVVAASTAFRKAAPVQQSILRDSTIITLMSHVEAVIADLIHAYYTRFPAAMPADERTLSLNDLRDLGNIEEAERFLIAKEVDSLLRESLETQFDYFRKRFKVDLNPLDPFLNRIVEINLRRNLFVHNRGLVNRTYVTRLPEGLRPESTLTLGEKLTTDEEYIAQAIDMAELCGIILITQCWRKWEKTEAEAAEGFLVDSLFETLQDRRNQLVESLAEFAYTLEMSEAGQRVACINHAIALRDSSRPDEVPIVLARHDWSATSLRFKLAIHAVLNEEDELYRLLPRAVAAEEIKKEELSNWPLFRPFRGSDRFSREVSQVFLISDEPANEAPPD